MLLSVNFLLLMQLPQKFHKNFSQFYKKNFVVAKIFFSFFTFITQKMPYFVFRF